MITLELIAEVKNHVKVKHHDQTWWNYHFLDTTQAIIYALQFANDKRDLHEIQQLANNYIVFKD